VDGGVYEVEAEVEAFHWWFVGRRQLLRRQIDRLGLTRGSPVLDVGTGTGSHLRLLREMAFTRVQGVDCSPEAIRFCAAKGLGEVRQGDICCLPFPDNSFRLVLATDVIEHVDDDATAVAELHRVLAPGGTALITVPAFPSLWGLQDVVGRHKRRYRLGPLRSLVERAGLRTRESFYFNYLLFAPIWMARQVIRLFNIQLKSENQVNNRWLNRLFTGIFSLDVASSPWLCPPFGVSILLAAVKQERPVPAKQDAARAEPLGVPAGGPVP
jgi:SAM-dependent methyltransferase